MSSFAMIVGEVDSRGGRGGGGSRGGGGGGRSSGSRSAWRGSSGGLRFVIDCFTP